VTPRGRRVAVVVALGGLLLAAAAVRSPAPAGRPGSTAPAAATATTAPATIPSAVAGRHVVAAVLRRDPLPSPPPSQAGADADGALGLDADGRLRLDLDLRRRFDWHRSALGELDEAAVRRRLEHELLALPAAARAEALDWYDRYLDLLAASEQLGTIEDPLATLDRLRALRRQWLGDAGAEAFFADEELALEARLLRRQVLADHGLEPHERQARLAAIDERLPAELRPSPELGQVAEALALDARHAAAAADPAQRHAERVAQFGTAAAERLAVLDGERADWQRRVAEHLALQQALQQDPSLTPEQRAQRLARDRQARFDETGQRRLQAWLAEGLHENDGG
jgi:lipase chaperone LimK